MSVVSLTLRNFRCFKAATFDFSSSITLIQGNNGSGKTSLLEALHYGCHLRSFRTHLPAELATDKGELEGFNLAIKTDLDEITIGISGKRRLVKINGAQAASYQELVKSYKVITFIEDDLDCIKGYPEGRRNLIDQAILVQEPRYYTLLKNARKITEHRNKILQDHPFHHENYGIWTEQFIQTYKEIIGCRLHYLEQLNSMLTTITQEYGSEDLIRLEYRIKRPFETLQERQLLQTDERAAGRVLCGPHLDDVEFIIGQRNSRAASRGQQKLAMMFLKIAQARILMSSNFDKLVFLIDDFLTDFDTIRIAKLLNLLFELRVQLIITVPQQHDLLYSLCAKQGTFNLITIE